MQIIDGAEHKRDLRRQKKQDDPGSAEYDAEQTFFSCTCLRLLVHTNNSPLSVTRVQCNIL